MSDIALSGESSWQKFLESVRITQTALCSFSAAAVSIPQERTTILIIEDSDTSGYVARQIALEVWPGKHVVVVPGWMEAAKHIPDACAMVVDWVLPDQMTMLDANIMPVIAERTIPTVIWTGFPHLVPETIGITVIDKTPEALEKALREMKVQSETV